MRCLTPILIKNPNFKHTGKNLYIYVPCGKCVNCLKKISDEWTMRVMLEYDHGNWDSSFFVTFTYDDGHLHDDGVNKRDLQLFHKRLRKAGFHFKYVVISEYGSHTKRPHYHGIYFGLPEYIFDDYWEHGFVYVKPVNIDNIRYVCGYHILKNEFKPEGSNDNFKLSSKGLGLSSFSKFELENAKRNDWKFLVDYDGNFHSIPRYFRKKFDVKFEPDDSFVIDDPKNFNSRLKITKIYKNKKFKKKML